MNLKKLIDKVSPALGDDRATQIGARMVQVFEDRLWAYGGEFCISVPCALDLAVAFHPDKVSEFFGLDRKDVTFTSEKGKLVVRSGARTVSVPTLPKSEVSVLTVFGDPVPATLNRDNLKFAASVVDPDSFRAFSRGVLFRKGFVWAGTGVDMFCGASGLPGTVPDFLLLKPSVQALASQKSPLIHIIYDPDTNYAVEFVFEDGTIIACRIMEGDAGDLSTIFKLPVIHRFGFSDEIMEEIEKVSCDRWQIDRTGLLYTTISKDTRLGSASGVIPGQMSAKPFPESLMVGNKYFKKGLEIAHTGIEMTERCIFFKGPQCAYAVARLHQPHREEQEESPRPVIKDKGPDRPAWTDDDEVPF